MPRFIDRNDAQCTLISVCFDDYVQPNSFEFALHYLIEHKLDLSCFDADYNNDVTGRKAYDPAILLKVVLYAYYKGITSSRQIASLCQRHITFMCLSSHSQPHWTTIAHFISSHPEAITSVFEQVLLICDQQGLLGHELIAIDGCKMSSDAAKEWSGTIAELTRKRDKLRRLIEQRLAQHEAADIADEADSAAREAQAVETLSNAADKLDTFLAEAEPRMGTGKKPKEVKSNVTDNESAKMTTSKGTIQGFNGVAAADKKHQIIVAAEAFGHGQEQHTLQPMLEGLEQSYQDQDIHDDILGTDIVITADTGYANEANNQYLHEHEINGYIPDNQFRSRDPRLQDKVAHHGSKATSKQFAADRFEFHPIKHTCICPAGESLPLQRQATDHRGNEKIFFKARLSQCRGCPLLKQCLRNPDSVKDSKGHGRQVSFLLNKTSPFTDWMKRRVDSVAGKRIYGHRMSVVEPVFGNIGDNKRLNRFSLRGKLKVNAQWLQYCLVHNIEKLNGYGQIMT